MLNITKIDSVTGKPLEGAEFEVEAQEVDSFGNTQGTATTIATNVRTNTAGKNTNIIVKAFGEPEDTIQDLIEKSKNDTDFNTTQAGVFYGEHAWDK